MSRRKKCLTMLLESALVLLLVFGTASGKDAAEGWPQKPVTFIAHTGPGAVDRLMRTLATLTAPIIGKPIVVENRPGGSGATAMAYGMTKPADGYTFLSVTGSHCFAMAVGKIPYKAEDFVFIRSFQGEADGVSVRKDSPLKTLDDFVKAMKTSPDKYKVGGYGSAGIHQFYYYQLQQIAGFSSNWIPFDSGGQVPLNLLGGHIDVGFMTPSSSVSQVKNGEIRLLAMTSAKRSEYFPDVPTFRELGYDMDGILWRGIMAKKGTPPAIIAKLNAAFDKVVAGAEWKKIMEKSLQQHDDTQGEALTKLVNKEIADRIKFLKEIGVRK